MIGNHYRHKKTGGTYTVLGRAISNVAFKDMDQVVLVFLGSGRMQLQKPEYKAFTEPLFRMVVTIQRSSKVELPCSWVVYQAHHDNSIWARPAFEFLDGRFEKVVENSN